MPPFVIQEKDTEHPSGIFPILVDEIINKCCGNCSKGHGISHIRYGTPKETLNDMKDTITAKEVVHISFPVSGKETDEEYKVSKLVNK